LLDIRGIASFADYFVICTGTSDRMLQALVDAVVEAVRNQYKVHARVEGVPREGWLLADFGDVVLHLFSIDRRNYYALEELWEKGKVVLHMQ